MHSASNHEPVNRVRFVNRDADDSVVEFADRVHKINKRNKMQVRWLVITGLLC
jgi:hypothetical protein